jgi:hypothetical protein
VSVERLFIIVTGLPIDTESSQPFVRDVVAFGSSGSVPSQRDRSTEARRRRSSVDYNKLSSGSGAKNV